MLPTCPVTSLPNRWSLPVAELRQPAKPKEPAKQVFAIPFAERIGKTVLVAGTFDTKGRELHFMVDRLKALGIPVKTVDLSTSGKPTRTDIPALQVASALPGQVMTGDRGGSVTAMAAAFAKWISQERGIGGVLSAGGSGGTSIATAGMRALPVGIPKIMVSTVASSDVSAYVGGCRYPDAPLRRRCAGAERHHRAGAGQCRPCHGRHGRATADR